MREREEVSVSANDQTVEEWAASAHFPQPLRLGAVEAGILARRPAASTSLGRSYPLLVALTWPVLAFAFMLGPGLALLGLLAAYLGTSQEPPVGQNMWLWVSHVIFVVGAFTELSALVDAVKSRHREWFHLGTALLTAAATALAFVLLRSSPWDEPWGLTPAVVAMGVFAIGVIVVSVLAKPRAPGPNAGRNPPKRGPENDNEYWHYKRTRTHVLDTLIRRGLLKIDEADRTRLNEMPLGYWEELDNVDEREWRRILEYRIVGWREFTQSDRRAWSPPEKQTKRRV
jgi:hypothetical protein